MQQGLTNGADQAPTDTNDTSRSLDAAWQARLDAVRARIADACARAGRSADTVRLLAVSKTFAAEDVLALAASGQRAFGENYVQEGVDKIERCLQLQDATEPAAALEWHFIGPLQSNKTRTVAERFDWVHSVERAKIAQRLSDQRPADAAPLNVCVQVNVSGEASKSGCAPSDAPTLAQQIAAMPRLRLRGLMAIPEPTEDMAQQRRAFAALRTIYESIRASGMALDTLSMGMSADLEAAIAEGSTLVRVGTALFGARPQLG